MVAWVATPLAMTLGLGGALVLVRSRSTRATSTATPLVEVTQVAPPPLPLSASRASSSQRYILTFAARVREARGIALAPRTACTLDVATYVSELSESYQPKLTCGGKVLYDGRGIMASISERSITEVAGDAPDGWRYRFLLDETQLRSPYLGVRINTEDGTIETWRENPPLYRVLLDVDELSAERRGDPLVPASAERHLARAALVLEAKVTSVTGAAPVQQGAACSVRLQPVLSESSCRAKLRIRCGTAILYGKGTKGYAGCEATDGQLTSFTDTVFTPADGDPAVTLDAASGSLRIRDESPTQKYVVVMALHR